MWDRCKVNPVILGFINTCGDADVVMSASKDGGATWSAPAPVNAAAQDQFFPWVKTDRSTNVVNVIFYSSELDAFQHRLQVKLAQINPGAATPDPVSITNILASSLDDPSSDPTLGNFFFGDYIGVAARGTGTVGASHAYGHWTFNTVAGSYNGVSVPEQNNHLGLLVY